MDREAIMTAFCNLVFSAAGFKDTGRRVKLWSQVTRQPAVFVRNIGDEYQQVERLPRRTILKVEIWIYTKGGESPDATPAAAINELVDAVEAVLKPEPSSGRLTLGGLVQHVWLEGESIHDPGDADTQAKAVLPVKILVP